MVTSSAMTATVLPILVWSDHGLSFPGCQARLSVQKFSVYSHFVTNTLRSNFPSSRLFQPDLLPLDKHPTSMSRVTSTRPATDADIAVASRYQLIASLEEWSMQSNTTARHTHRHELGTWHFMYLISSSATVTFSFNTWQTAAVELGL